jgi:hypothetical protein
MIDQVGRLRYGKMCGVRLPGLLPVRKKRRDGGVLGRPHPAMLLNQL